MQAGRLRRRITLERPSRTRDTAGGFAAAWTPVCESLPAAIEPSTGREFFASSQVQSDVDTAITIRYRHGVTAQLRAVVVIAQGSPDEVEIYNIQAVLPDETGRKWLTLLCKRRAADGFQADG